MSPKATEMLGLLRTAALEYANQRGWWSASQVTIFCPQGVMAQALGVDPSTIRRWFYRYQELRQAVAMRRHYTSISTSGGGRRTVIDGTLWTVRLRPGRGEVRVPHHDLVYAGYRNLEADIAAGRTLPASSKPTGVISLEEQVKCLLGWAFGAPDVTPVGSCHDPCSLDEAFDGGDTRVMASTISRVLGDRHSLRFWIRECRSWAQRGRAFTLKLQVERVLADRGEGFARSAAALVVSRLRPTAA